MFSSNSTSWDPCDLTTRSPMVVRYNGGLETFLPLYLTTALEAVIASSYGELAGFQKSVSV